MGFENYIKISRRSLFFRYYVIFDTSKHLVDNLFINHKVKVKFLYEFAKDETCYRFISCRIRKKDECKFMQALDDLKNKMLLYGHSDYEDFCNNTIQKAKEFF